MKIVIDIPEELYKNIQKRSTEIQAEGLILENAVLNGTPPRKEYIAAITFSKDDLQEVIDKRENDYCTLEQGIHDICKQLADEIVKELK